MLSIDFGAHTDYEFNCNAISLIIKNHIILHNNAFFFFGYCLTFSKTISRIIEHIDYLLIDLWHNNHSKLICWLKHPGGQSLYNPPICTIIPYYIHYGSVLLKGLVSIIADLSNIGCTLAESGGFMGEWYVPTDTTSPHSYRWLLSMYIQN